MITMFFKLVSLDASMRQFAAAHQLQAGQGKLDPLLECDPEPRHPAIGNRHEFRAFGDEPSEQRHYRAA